MEHPSIEGYRMHSENKTPMYRASCVTLGSYAGSRQELDAQRAKPSMWEALRVCYDMKTDRLELQRHAVEHSIPTQLARKDFI